MTTSPRWPARRSSRSPARIPARWAASEAGPIAELSERVEAIRSTGLPRDLPMPATDETGALDRYRGLARLWDNLLRIPGTPVRLGWDALLGLIPGLGDATGGLLGAYGLWVAWRLGAPAAVLTRMFLNVGVDVALGVVPFAGDLFDIAWRSNSRNVALVDRWLERPSEVGRRSGALLAGLTALVLLLAGAVVWVAWMLVREAAALLAR
jgi:hypothetical protein